MLDVVGGVSGFRVVFCYQGFAREKPAQLAAMFFCPCLCVLVRLGFCLGVVWGIYFLALLLVVVFGFSGFEIVFGRAFAR